MAVGEFEHLADGRAVADGAAADGLLPEQQLKARNLQVSRRRAQDEHRAASPQDAEPEAPIQRSEDRVQDEILRVRGGFHVAGVFGDDEVMRPKSAGFVFLVGRRGKGGHFASHRGGELDAQMSQAPNADHAHLVMRLNPKQAHRRINRDASAQQRRSVLGGHAVGNEKGEASIHPNGLREAAGPSDASGAVVGTAIFLAPNAPLAIHARAALPADAHALARLQMGPGARRPDNPDDLMSGHERVLANSPIVINQVNVAMANAAVGDFDFHLVRAERGGIICVRLKLLLRLKRGVGVDGHEVLLSFGSASPRHGASRRQGQEAVARGALLELVESADSGAPAVNSATKQKNIHKTPYKKIDNYDIANFYFIFKKIIFIRSTNVMIMLI